MDRDYELTDKDNTFFYFEIIKQTNAKRILDIGMFLKRIGALTRQVGELTIQPDIILDALDIPDAPDLPIYTTIYNNIYGDIKKIHHKYDLVISLNNNTDPSSISRYASALAIDCKNENEFFSLRPLGKSIKDIHIEEKLYALITF